jgi:hypothetical protein
MKDTVSRDRMRAIFHNPSSAEFESDIDKLVSYGLEKGLVDDCHGFVLDPIEFCLTSGLTSLDELVLDHLGDEQGTSELEKIDYFRGLLKDQLRSPAEDTQSFFNWVIDTESGAFVICVLIAVRGYELSCVDYFALKNESEVPQQLRLRGYLISESDIDALTGEQVRSFWDKCEIA